MGLAVCEAIEDLLDGRQIQLKWPNDVYIERRKVSRTNDAQLASLLGKNSEVGRTMQYTADLEAKFRALTVADVNDAIRKYFDHDKLFITVAGDL